MPDTLTDKAKALLDRPVLATLVTLDAHGAPQATPLWLETDGNDVLVNTAKGRVKANNMERDPRVAVTVLDPADPYNVVALRGTVVEMTNEGADAHIDRLAHKYLGVDAYPNRTADEVRLIVRIRVDHVAMQPS